MTLDYVVVAIRGFLDRDGYIHIDRSDIKKSARALRSRWSVRNESPAAIGEALGIRLSNLEIAADDVAGAALAIKSPDNVRLAEVASIVGCVRARLSDKVAIIWGLDLTDTDTLRAAMLLAVPREQ